MNKDLADKLKEALTPTIQTYTWKTQNKKIIKMIDCSDDELIKFHHHAQEMLYNDNIKSPGKVIIKSKLNRLYEKINAELCNRYILYDVRNELLNTNRKLIDYLQHMCKTNGLQLADNIGIIFENLPIVYNDVTIGDLFDSCFDKLGVFNKKLISDKFILSLGLWLTPQEMNEFLEYKNGKPRSRIDVIKERFDIEGDFKVSPGGLSFVELRSLMAITGVMKINAIPTTSLKLLRDKVIILLISENDNAISQWETLKSQLEEVMEHKKI